MCTILDLFSSLLFPLQKDKLQQELALVKGNLIVMNEMLNEVKPGQSKQDDTELLQVCSFSTCLCV